MRPSMKPCRFVALTKRGNDLRGRVLIAPSHINCGNELAAPFSALSVIIAMQHASRSSSSALSIALRASLNPLRRPSSGVRRSVATSSVSFSSTASKPRDAPSFPCVDAHAAREERILKRSVGTAGPALTSPPTSSSPSSSSSSSTSTKNPSESGPEPPYARPNPKSYKLYHHAEPFQLIYSPENPLPEFDIAYETWGTLNASKSNAILLHTGLSASSHAASTELNPSPGWWEKFIGPGKALDTNQFFIICTNVLGGCYGSTGPSSPNPLAGDADGLGREYGTNFPVLSIWDMVRAQWMLIDHLGIDKLYASVGSSMGGMSSLATAW